MVRTVIIVITRRYVVARGGVIGQQHVTIVTHVHITKHGGCQHQERHLQQGRRLTAFPPIRTALNVTVPTRSAHPPPTYLGSPGANNVVNVLTDCGPHAPSYLSTTYFEGLMVGTPSLPSPNGSLGAGRRMIEAAELLDIGLRFIVEPP